MKEITSHISINSEIRFGKPCIKGTRIAVVDVLQWLASGMTQEQILNEYPSSLKSIYWLHLRLLQTENP